MKLFSFKNFLIVLILAVLLITVFIISQKSSWTEYESPQGKFSIKAPPEAEVEVDMPGWGAPYRTEIKLIKEEKKEGFILGIQSLKPSEVVDYRAFYDYKYINTEVPFEEFMLKEKEIFYDDVSKIKEKNIVINGISGVKMRVDLDEVSSVKILLNADGRYYELIGAVFNRNKDYYLETLDKIVNSFVAE